MKSLTKITFFLLFGLLLARPLAAQNNSHIVSYLPFTPCIGVPMVFTAIDTSGNFPMGEYYFDYGDGSTGYANWLNPSATHSYTTPGTYNVSFIAWDSLNFGVDSIFFEIVVDSFCANHDLVTGVSYNDLNGNGSQDPGELGYPHQLIEITPGPNYITTDANGNYAVQIPTGAYTLTMLPPLYRTVTEPVSGAYNITSAGTGAVQSGKDFGLEMTPGQNDLRVVVAGGPPVPGFNRYYTIHYANVGTTVLNSTVEFDYGAPMTFVSAVGGTNSGTTVSWAVGNLNPGQTGTVNVTLNCPIGTPLGGTVNHYATIQPTAGDLTPLNNVDTLSKIVVGSYDPNDKAGLPAGVGASGDINPGTPITYTVRFQNTGTYFATDVIIRDTLDADFDQSTLEVLGASHAFTWHNDFGKLAFEFRQIMLPDSNSNEPASHGWVKYKIAPKSTLPLGTELTNSASIYFDFNAPILTNTTLHTLAVVTAVEPKFNLAGVKVAPNPFRGSTQFTFDNPNAEVYEMMVYDMAGKMVISKQGITGSSFILDASMLPQGLFMYNLVGSEGSVAKGKIVIQ